MARRESRTGKSLVHALYMYARRGLTLTGRHVPVSGIDSHNRSYTYAQDFNRTHPWPDQLRCGCGTTAAARGAFRHRWTRTPRTRVRPAVTTQLRLRWFRRRAGRWQRAPRRRHRGALTIPAPTAAPLIAAAEAATAPPVASSDAPRADGADNAGGDGGPAERVRAMARRTPTVGSAPSSMRLRVATPAAGWGSRCRSFWSRRYWPRWDSLPSANGRPDEPGRRRPATRPNGPGVRVAARLTANGHCALRCWRT